MKNYNERTLQKEVKYTGIGIHTGQPVTMRFCPQKEGSGLFFRRMDLPGRPTVPVSLSCAKEFARSTTLVAGEARVNTVEHVLAALYTCGISNLEIQLDNGEPPIGNGSSDVFMEMIEEAAILEQAPLREMIVIDQPVYYSENEIQLVALPYDGYRISYTLHYPNSPYLRTQFFSIDVTPDTFKKEVASCRTFVLYEEIAPLLDQGLIRGASLDNAVVIQGETVLSKNGLFFRDEMARHKVLDIIGDLALLEKPICGHIIAVRSGHATNHKLACEIEKVYLREGVKK